MHQEYQCTLKGSRHTNYSLSSNTVLQLLLCNDKFNLISVYISVRIIYFIACYNEGRKKEIDFFSFEM